MAALYLIEILHQTTTSSRARARLLCCILSKFYIKPQLRRWRECHYVVVSYRNSTSNHNVDGRRDFVRVVVSYRNSTSNHNTGLINGFLGQVVSYRNSTSNHNCQLINCNTHKVVSYRNSTSNHNFQTLDSRPNLVVSYRNSTSNHNYRGKKRVVIALYLIEILHQTTTLGYSPILERSLYLIEILHQTTTAIDPLASFLCCILSKFYIKPQHATMSGGSASSCILSKFYIKPQLFCV